MKTIRENFIEYATNHMGMDVSMKDDGSFVDDNTNSAFRSYFIGALDMRVMICKILAEELPQNTVNDKPIADRIGGALARIALMS